MTECLLIKTPEDKYALANTNAKHSLLGYAKTFGAEIYIVETDETPLPLKQLVKQLHNGKGLTKTKPPYKNIKPLYIPEPEKPKDPNRTVIEKDNYKDFLNQAQKVKDYIYSELSKGKTVSLNTIQEWAKQQKIEVSKGGLSRHLQKTLDKLVKEGYSKNKIGRSYNVSKG